MIKRTIIIILAILILPAFIATLSGCQSKEPELESCSLPYVKSVFSSDQFTYSTYVLLCGPDIVESGIQVRDAGTGKLLSSNNILKDWAGGLFVKGEVIFVANGINGMVTVDASDSSELEVIARLDTPGYANEIFIYKDHAYIADGTAGLVVIDIKDKTSPEIVYTRETGGYVWDVFVDEDNIYIASGDTGLEIIDRKELIRELD